MRHQTLKLKKGRSTAAERKMMQLLNELRIPFRTKVRIEGREIDFLVGRYAIEINGHPQDPSRNVQIINAGYTPVHVENRDVNPSLKSWLRKLYNGQHRLIHSRTAPNNRKLVGP